MVLKLDMKPQSVPSDLIHIGQYCIQILLTQCCVVSNNSHFNIHFSFKLSKYMQIVRLFFLGHFLGCFVIFMILLHFQIPDFSSTRETLRNVQLNHKRTRSFIGDVKLWFLCRGASQLYVQNSNLVFVSSSFHYIAILPRYWV